MEGTELPKLTDPLEIDIVRLFEEGGTYRSVAKALGISPETIRQMIRDDERAAFQALYARARAEQAHTYADAVQDIANDPDIPPDEKRVRIDAMKWSAGKRQPRVYGDKVQLGGDGGEPIKVEATAPAPPETLARALLAIVAKAETDAS